jgi:hypothetical protein
MKNHFINFFNEIFLGCLNSAQRQHIQQFIMFFIFNVVLVTSDIVSDFITAFNFFNDRHFYWGICTLVPMFAAFAVRFSVAVFELAKVTIRKVAFVSLTNVLLNKVTNLKLQLCLGVA